MKHLIIILILLLSGCSQIEYYPDADTIRFFNHYKPYKCYKCKKDTFLCKVDSKDRIICDICFRKLVKPRRIKRIDK